MQLLRSNPRTTTTTMSHYQTGAIQTIYNIPNVLPQVGSGKDRAHTNLTPYLMEIDKMFPKDSTQATHNTVY